MVNILGFKIKEDFLIKCIRGVDFIIQVAIGMVALIPIALCFS